jgi:hypothetical protein
VFALGWFSSWQSVVVVVVLTVGPVGVSVSPNTATADHTAAPPDNQQQFFAFNSFPIKQGCAAITAAILNNVTWSTSDPGDVSISNTQGSTYGVATCINAVGSPGDDHRHAAPTERRHVYRHRIVDMQNEEDASSKGHTNTC